MLVSAKQLKWLLRFYPPLFFQRIWVQKISNDFRSLTIKISKSIFNLNYNRSIFGGTIFSAADFCFPVLLHQSLKRKGYEISVWSRSAEIHFLKKVNNSISFSVKLSEEDLNEIESILNTTKKFTKAFPINMFNNNGEVCVVIKCEVYMRINSNKN